MRDLAQALFQPACAAGPYGRSGAGDIAGADQKLATYDPDRAFLPWLAAIARYRWVDHLRRIYRADETELEEGLIGGSDEPAIAARISLNRLIEQLPSAQAQAIELVKIEGLSVAEASRACGQSESLIKVNIHRGIKKLTTIIEKA